MPDDDVEPTDARPAVHDAAFYVAAILAALFLLRLLGAAWSSHFPAAWPDAGNVEASATTAMAATTDGRPTRLDVRNPATARSTTC